MRYLGGKTRNANAISKVINHSMNGRDYLEPFCGGLSVSVRIESRSMMLSDIHPGLISLYKDLYNDTFIFPEKVGREEYDAIKNAADYSDPLSVLIGFGLSYAGKWWGGYDSYYDTRNNVGKTWTMLRSSTVKKFKALREKNVTFVCEDYKKFDPANCVIYCDPPYKNTTSYDFVGDFNHDEFWKTIRHWSSKNTVFVSEFDAPSDFECVWSAPYKIQMCAEQKSAVEKLFVLRK